MPLRGKELPELTHKQANRVGKNFEIYKASRKGRQNPDMTIEEYLPILQKQAITSLWAAIGLIPFYIWVVASFYSQLW